MRKLVLVSALALVAASCSREAAPTSIDYTPQQKNELAVLDKAEELVGAMYRQDFGKVWDMMTPWNKHDATREGVTREVYAGKVGNFMDTGQIRMTDYDSSEIVVIGDKYAITQAELTYQFTEGGQTQSMTDCERTLWLEFPEGWFWHQTSLVCEYMPSAEEIERLTRNLK